MAYPGAVDDFRGCCELQRPRRMPLFAIGLEYDMRLAGITRRQTRQDADKTVRYLLSSVERSGYDWAMVFPDDYIEFEPMGMPMSDEEDRPTMPTQYLDMDGPTLSRLRIPDANAEMRLPMHLDVIRRVKGQLGDTACVVGRIAAPFSAPGLVYGIDKLLINLLQDPGLVRDNVSFFIEHQIAFGRAQLDAGADVLWLGDCVADSNFLRMEHFAEFAFEPACRVAEAMRDAGGLVIYHSGEPSLPHLKWQCQIPAAAVNVGEGVSIAEVHRATGAKNCLMGNLDPKLLRDGTPEQVRDATKQMVEQNLASGAYVFNTGEGVMQNSPEANVQAMLQTARDTADSFLGGKSP